MDYKTVYQQGLGIVIKDSIEVLYSTDMFDWICFDTKDIESAKDCARIVRPGGYIIMKISNWSCTKKNIRTVKELFKDSIEVNLIEIIKGKSIVVVLQKKLRLGNILIITAHLDDYVVWSSTLVQKINARFLVISVTSLSKVYLNEFYLSIKKLQKDRIEIDGLSLKMKVSRLGHLNHDILKKKLIAKLVEWNFVPDIILTHNKEGEYGHQQHKDVHQVVHELFGNNVFDFDKNHYYLPVPSKAFGSKLDLLRIFKSQKEGLKL